MPKSSVIPPNHESMTLILPVELKQGLEALKSKHRTTLSSEAIEAIRRYLREPQAKANPQIDAIAKQLQTCTLRTLF